MSNLQDSERVLILTPKGRDADVAANVLAAQKISSEICVDVEFLCEEIRRGAGTVLLATEALPRKAIEQLGEVLDEQPSWSELPVIIFAAEGGGVPTIGPLEARNHITLVDRPIRVKALVSAVRSAIRARRRQYQLRDLMAAIERRVQERDRFLAILGHELRNPLGAILLAAQMHSEDGRLEDEHARLIERQARHLTRLVDDLLDLSRVTSGKIVLRKQPVNLSATVTHSMETLSDSFAQQKLEVQLRLDSDAVVDGDPVRIEQIVSNLLTNAMKYTPAGGHVLIEVTSDGKLVKLKVTDDGIGIPAERLPLIFGLFAQAENAIGRSQGGMGIGLSLVKTLVELHGGTVSANSGGSGKGSDFTVQFPASSATINPAPEAPRADTQRPRQIVVVEDNPDVRKLLQLKLERMGHEVHAVADGEGGVELIDKVRPDLALVDIGLPDIDGFEVARRVRAQNGADIFLVALSGFGQPEDKRKAADAGFDEHLTKPTDVQDLEKLLRRTRRRMAS